jgi:hypothetical protein
MCTVVLHKFLLTAVFFKRFRVFRGLTAALH